MLAGAGANITVQIGDDSVLVVDSGEAGMSDKVIAAIRRISNKPFHTMISTNSDLDHVGGNERVAQSGSQIGGIGSTLNSGLAEVPTENSAAIIAHENVLTKMSAPTGGKTAAPTNAWPTETYATDEYEVVNGEGIQIFYEPAAHTDGDSLVYFRRSDVISTGDIFSTVSYPVHRDMVTIIRDRVLDMMTRGMTMEQVKAAKPTSDYDGRYSTSFWTADMFIEAVYRSLQKTGDSPSTAR